MIEGLDSLLAGQGHPGIHALQKLLESILGGPETAGRLDSVERLRPRVHRLTFELDDGSRSFVIKRLRPDRSQREQMVIGRWLPAVGLGEYAPALLGTAADASGQCFWHLYEDLGEWGLDPNDTGSERIRAALTAIARVHTRFSGHVLLPECRLFSGDLSFNFYSTSVRDAIRGLESLPLMNLELSEGRLASRDQLLAHMTRLLDEEDSRRRVMAEWSGPETFLHGDCSEKNTLAVLNNAGLQVRFIDWDHSGVGPVSYDLSNFLVQFPASARRAMLDFYRGLIPADWRLPTSIENWNVLFDTAEFARLANCIAWNAIEIFNGQDEDGFAYFRTYEHQLRHLSPVLPPAPQPAQAGQRD